jgi:hypothetical protein
MGEQFAAILLNPLHIQTGSGVLQDACHTVHDAASAAALVVSACGKHTNMHPSASQTTVPMGIVFGISFVGDAV